MNIPVFYRICGYYRIRTEEKYQTRLRNIFLVLHIPSYMDKNGCFYLMRRDKERVAASAKRERLPLTVSEACGIPSVLKRQRHRAGIPLGVMLGIFLLILGSNTIWRVEVSGNEQISGEEIEADLSALGFGVGSSSQGVDYNTLIAAYRLAHPEIAWMGIYSRGTTAYIRVIENERHEEEGGSLLPSHLVAGEDAVIESCEISHGTSVVRVGSVVKKGDVLALGIAKGSSYDRIMAAEGCIIGRVSKTLSLEIPYVATEKKEVFRKVESISLNFFQKILNFFKNTNKNALDYVIIERKEMLRLWNGITLPFGFTVKEAVYYTEQQVTRNISDLLLEGMNVIEAMIRNEIGSGDLISKNIQVQEKDGSLLVLATVEYTKNIAERLSFALGDGGSGG